MRTLGDPGGTLLFRRQPGSVVKSKCRGHGNHLDVRVDRIGPAPLIAAEAHPPAGVATPSRRQARTRPTRRAPTRLPRRLRPLGTRRSRRPGTRGSSPGPISQGSQTRPPISTRSSEASCSASAIHCRWRSRRRPASAGRVTRRDGLVEGQGSSLFPCSSSSPPGACRRSWRGILRPLGTWDRNPRRPSVS